MTLDPLQASPATPVTGMEKWDWNTTERVPEEFLQLTLIADPNYAVIQRRAIDGALAYCDEHFAFQATISDMGGFFLCGIALYMDCTGGLTHRRLREMTGESGIISAGRASALLWRLRLGKFVEPADGEGNHKRFVPTRAMRAAMQARLKVEYQALQVMEPRLDDLLALFEQPGTLDLIIRQMGDDMLSAAGRPDPRLDDFSKIATRNYGVILMYAIAAASRDMAVPVVPPVAALARRFRISRSHVLRVLRMMEEAGYLEDTERGRIVLPSLAAALRLFQGFMFAGELRAAHRALLSLAQGAHSPG